MHWNFNDELVQICDLKINSGKLVAACHFFRVITPKINWISLVQIKATARTFVRHSFPYRKYVASGNALCATLWLEISFFPFHPMIPSDEVTWSSGSKLNTFYWIDAKMLFKVWLQFDLQCLSMSNFPINKMLYFCSGKVF